jgi:hypothetical protein
MLLTRYFRKEVGLRTLHLVRGGLRGSVHLIAIVIGIGTGIEIIVPQEGTILTVIVIVTVKGGRIGIMIAIVIVIGRERRIMDLLSGLERGRGNEREEGIDT